MPDLSPDQWAAYCEHLTLDPLAPRESVMVAQVIRHSGADLGEVIGYKLEDGSWTPGMCVADIRTDQLLSRIAFKRQKVAASPERFVPYPKKHVTELLRHIGDNSLAIHEPVFGMVDRLSFIAAHKRAARAMGKPKFRIKDFRHLAAIAWARAGTRLERIQVWLGHSSINLTAVYAQFAPDDVFDLPLVEKAAALAEAKIS
jgi:integrase